MTLSIKVNNQVYESFTQAQADRDIEKVASSFSFTATSSKNKQIPITAGDFVEVLADGNTIITGYVDEYSVSYDSKEHVINIKGRSKTSDIVDSTMLGIKQINKIPLKKLCEDVLKDLYDGVVGKYKVNVNSNTDEEGNALGIYTAGTGTTVFNFLEENARSVGILLSDDEKGNLLLNRPGQEKSSIVLKNKVGGDDNNIKRAVRVSNISNLFYEYTANSMNVLYKAKESDNIKKEDSTTVSLRGTYFDDEIRKTKKLEFLTEISTQKYTLKERARWERDIRKARGLVYRAVLAGHSQDGTLLKENLLYDIEDDFAGIKRECICKRVIYRYNLDVGSETEMFFTSAKAYSLEAVKDIFVEGESYRVEDKFD